MSLHVYNIVVLKVVISDKFFYGRTIIISEDDKALLQGLNIRYKIHWHPASRRGEF